MNREVSYAITFPDSYYKTNADYPVVYLLHGAGGNYSNWHKSVKKPSLLPDLANTYEMVIVTPEVAPYSYYYDSPIMDSVRYESYITMDLIKEIDEKYRTIASKGGRAITGLSMGGHGAITLSAKHPDLFFAAGSMSGVMNIDTRGWDIDEKRKDLRKKQQKEMLGEINYDAPFSPYTAVGFIEKMKENDVKMIIDCGTEDFLLGTNRQMHQLLLEAGVAHDYIERPGAHNWGYWTNSLPYHFLFFNEHLRK
ncbi:putative esterase [Cyclobacterium qasimii M12-11B]|uniref:Putative esterase n=1 Tax=Cyclobacterium qasimii M12-11B TaxID=641524 RepID=S7WUR3_9BACT|nr:putative esterase [Cyclobacterium qasimii M12-11B]